MDAAVGGDPALIHLIKFLRNMHQGTSLVTTIDNIAVDIKAFPSQMSSRKMSRSIFKIMF